jgi:phage terminase large subunit-like protein
MTPILNEKTLQLILNDRKLRSSLTRESAIYFATIYFPHYFGYGFAQFQYDMFGIVEDRRIEFAIAITFRGSGKSTLFTTIAPLWYVMGILQKKHVLIVCQTQEQARSHMASIKAELEANELLRDDLGPFKETNTTWNSMSLEFSKYGAKITAVSIDQSIRGLRYKQYRPDVIICDDIEDSSSVKTKEGRKRIHELYSSEIAPLGDINTKIIMVGNYLHPNSLLTTLRETLKSGNFEGRGKELFVPLVNDEQQIALPQKFQSMVDIERLRELVADYRIWMQEYMLKVVPEEDQLVTYNDIRWYDEIPSGWEPYFRFRAAGVDLAISKSLRSDLTAIVSAEVYRNGKDYHIFIQRNPINKRFNFRETIEFLHDFKGAFPGTHLFVESVGYQESLIEQLREEGINAHEAKIGNLSKQERLAIVVHWIRKGMIHFPADGATDLVNQIVNFGAELHDDLVDAFTLLIMQIMKFANDDAIPTETDDYSGPMIIPGGFMNWAIRTHSPSRKFNPRTLENDRYGFNQRDSLYD